MIPLGQFRDTFIIAVDDEGVAIIDQHVAHERVLFERVMERLTAGRLESQRLLVPLVLELRTVGASGARRPRRGARAPRLRDREPSATATIKVDGGSGAARDRGQLEGARSRWPRISKGWTAARSVQDALQRIAATTACHAAVKANDPLTYEKMTHILDELRATAYSTICPHGRPVMLRLTRREIEKNFDRI